MAELAELTLENLKGGAVPVLFQRELTKVLANIQDPNTPAKKKRRITITVDLTPEEDRERATLALQVSSSVPAHKPEASLIYLGERDGQLVAVGFDPKQRDLFGEEAKDPTITPIQRKEALHD